MNNASEYITGDDMMALLIGQGGSKAATYALSDTSDDAVRARFAELVEDGEIVGSERDCLVPTILFMISDLRALIGMGLIYDRGRSGDYMYLTDAGAAFVKAHR
jgi:hypothetical protein